MKITVCIRQGLDGDISPFDACAYEAALRIEGAEITLVSMGPASAGDLLLKLTRLGAKRAVLLSDRAFAGADTLATAYTLTEAIKRISPDIVLCGRQTLVGDTSQTGPILAELSGLSLITNVMSIEGIENGKITCKTRSEGDKNVSLPALLTLERINSLRLPRLRSKLGELEVWSADDLGVDVSKCGLKGSPTRVVKTFENQSGKRKCKFITRDELPRVIEEALEKSKAPTEVLSAPNGEMLTDVCIVGSAPYEFATTVSNNVTEIPITDADSIVKRINELLPSAVIWGSDTKSKRLAALVAAKMKIGLCADCTRLEAEGGELMMYRPALSGSVIAKIRSLTRPAMATVRTESTGEFRVIVAAGFGVKDKMDEIEAFAKALGAEICSSRKLVDNGYTTYETQVGLTGKTVAPPVYIAIGISGAVHHIAGMQKSATVIAINPDKNARIFEYADYGIVADFN